MVTSSFKNISVYRRNPRAVTFLSFTLATSILSAPMYSISAQAREKLTSAPLCLSIGNFKELFADYDLKLNNIKTIVEKLYLGLFMAGNDSHSMDIPDNGACFELLSRACFPFCCRPSIQMELMDFALAIHKKMRETEQTLALVSTANKLEKLFIMTLRIESTLQRTRGQKPIPSMQSSCLRQLQPTIAITFKSMY